MHDETDLETTADLETLRRFALALAPALGLDPTCITPADVWARRVDVELLEERARAAALN